VKSILVRLQQILQGYPSAGSYYVAFSGGLDSSVLLYLLADIRDQLPGELTAIHIHHGLQAQADAWGRHCEQFCQALAIPLRQIQLELAPKRGESLEALARTQRYAALASEMESGDVLLTAQHQDDQAETLLLQLLRGSGPAGLAAMPALSRFGAGWLARPLLDFSREELVACAKQQAIAWVEDPSNQDLRFDRNYLRLRVMPMLQQRWPAAPATIARSARLSGELQSLGDELASQDLEQAHGPWRATLSITALLQLSVPRRRSLLRHWVRLQGGTMPGSRHLLRVEEECLNCRRDAQPRVHWGDVEVRRFRDGLFLLTPLPAHDPAQVIAWSDAQPLSLPAGMGEVMLIPANSGLSLQKWRSAKVEIRFRQGGERCIPAGSKQHRSLKKLFQVWSVPPWLRDRIPLIYLDGELAAVPNRLLCEPFIAASGEPAVTPCWKTDAWPSSGYA
jgi:tRNA(Ile)-lysidine synthase